MPPKVDETGLKILFLLLPGIIALFLVKSVGPKRPRSDLEIGLQIFLYGIAAYALAGFVEGVFTWWYSRPPSDGFWKIVGEKTLGLATLNPEAALGTDQIAFATGVAVVIGLFVAFIQSYSLPHWALRKVRLTKRTGEVDVWGFTFNSPDLDSWVTVRHVSGKVYQGWVRGYSDGADERELVLADVKVYVPSAEQPNQLLAVDDVPVLYLGLDRKSIVIEMRTAA